MSSFKFRLVNDASSGGIRLKGHRYKIGWNFVFERIYLTFIYRNRFLSRACLSTIYLVASGLVAPGLVSSSLVASGLVIFF